MTDPDDIDREELRRIDIFQRKQAIKALNGYDLDPQNERPECECGLCEECVYREED